MARQIPDPHDRLRSDRPLPAHPAAPGEAREWAAKVLATWGLAGLADDVQVILTELVTNALLAGAGQISALIEWCPRVELVEVRVWDDAPGEPRPAALDAAAEAGRGLFLVEALSAGWGHHRDPGGGKVVWARLASS